jgi:hypothetical protein
MPRDLDNCRLGALTYFREVARIKAAFDHNPTSGTMTGFGHLRQIYKKPLFVGRRRCQENTSRGTESV